MAWPWRIPNPAALRGHVSRGQAGYALFFVLSLILLLSMLLMGVTRDSRWQARSALRTLETAQARADTETALSITIMHLLAAKPQNRWEADGTERRLMIGNKVWQVTVTPEDGMVDLNHAPPALLAELFAAAGVPAEEAQVLAGRVADWRDTDDLTHLNGAERREYESAGLPPPRNGPFLQPQELRNVMGMADGLYGCLVHAVTVHSGKAGIDRRFAPELLQMAQDGKDGETNTAPIRSPLTSNSIAGMAVAIELRAQGTIPPGSESRVIVRITENPGAPFWVLSEQHRLWPHQEEASECVSYTHRAYPKEEISTPKG